MIWPGAGGRRERAVRSASQDGVRDEAPHYTSGPRTAEARCRPRRARCADPASTDQHLTPRQWVFGTTREPAAAALYGGSAAEHRRGDSALRLTAEAQHINIPDTDGILAPHSLSRYHCSVLVSSQPPRGLQRGPTATSARLRQVLAGRWVTAVHHPVREAAGGLHHSHHLPLGHVEGSETAPTSREDTMLVFFPWPCLRPGRTRSRGPPASRGSPPRRQPKEHPRSVGCLLP